MALVADSADHKEKHAGFTVSQYVTVKARIISSSERYRTRTCKETKCTSTLFTLYMPDVHS